MINGIDCFGKETSLYIRPPMLFVRNITNIAKFIAQTAMTVKHFLYSHAQFISIEWLGEIGIGPSL